MTIFYVNCGSDSSVTYGDRTFVGDMASGSNSVSFTTKGTEASNQSGSSTAPEIYRTVRIFRHTSSYKFQIDPVGFHFVRLHFSAVSSRTELLTARFTVSATSGSTHHFKSFPVQNLNETSRIEEFLLMINSPDFEIRFVPDHSSVAFINAIEVFSAPDDLEITPDSDKNLHTIYRLNVGGEKITPENDTLGRTWSLDDDFLYQKDAARNNKTTQKPNYDSGSATIYTAPEFVYQTAKAINRSSNELTDMLMNITWSFKVRRNSKHFIRAHFCDILSQSQTPDSDFYLYVNGRVRRDVNPSEQERRKEAGFLNGLEVMEFLQGSDSSDKNSSSRVYIIAGCVAAGSILVLSLLFMVFLKRRRSSKKEKLDGEATVWSPLPLQRAGGSSDNRPFDPVYNSPLRSNNRAYDPVHNSPLRNLNLGLTIPFADIVRATNNFDERWLIGRGGFGDVYKAILPDGSKAAIKRGKTGSGQGILEFQTEIQVLTRIRHRHLVSLTGYCEENSEMILTHILTEKSDVYAFGVVLLEVLCARPALDRHLPHEEVNLAEWAMFCRDKGIIDEILDPKLIGQIEPSSLRKFMEIVEKCLKEYGELRPSMADVIWDLEYVLQLQMTPIHREPHEDSATISGGGDGSSLVIPRLMVSDSFSSNSFVQKKSSYGGTDSSETQVFSQLKISEAR
ncbi:unnamed protein product [Thlaspi arvense]|uniref:Protein kinase domain-containing protein n=1 Tax=Thlaspi arvense TaxID=13288 RepID=A0AAU9S7I7_THLAR|nr:unnamed protein product [Thlaspi arvense]